MLRKIVDFLKTVDPAQLKDFIALITMFMEIFAAKEGPFAAGADLNEDEFRAECGKCGCTEEQAQQIIEAVKG